MRTFRLHFPQEWIDQREIVAFLKPVKSKLIRVLPLTYKYIDDRELKSLLDGFCIRKVDGIWFFERDPNLIDLLLNAIGMIDVDVALIEPEVSAPVFERQSYLN